jgi:hypothetical protein
MLQLGLDSSEEGEKAKGSILGTRMENGVYRLSFFTVTTRRTDGTPTVTQQNRRQDRNTLGLALFALGNGVHASEIILMMPARFVEPSKT